MREDHVQFIIGHFELRGQKEYASIARQLAEENAKLRVLLKEAKGLVKELCQTYNNPFPNASFERFNEALKD